MLSFVPSDVGVEVYTPCTEGIGPNASQPGAIPPTHASCTMFAQCCYARASITVAPLGTTLLSAMACIILSFPSLFSPSLPFPFQLSCPILSFPCSFSVWHTPRAWFFGALWFGLGAPLRVCTSDLAFGANPAWHFEHVWFGLVAPLAGWV